jgi:ribosomal protein L35AE/L33A
MIHLSRIKLVKFINPFYSLSTIMVEGIINNFRLGRHTKSPNHMIVIVHGVDSKDKALSLVGKSVVYTTEANRKINGQVLAAHGSNGAVRVAFVTGMPGQSLGRKVEILG